MSQAIAHLGCYTIAKAQAELQWSGEEGLRGLKETSQSLSPISSLHVLRYANRMDGNPQYADTPILTDGLMSLMPLSKPTASNEADWREARMWLRNMAGMGLHRIESIMDGMTLILPTKLRSKISARAKSLIETAACSHSRIQDVRWTEVVSGPNNLLGSPIRFNERKSYDQVTQRKTSVGELFT